MRRRKRGAEKKRQKVGSPSSLSHQSFYCWNYYCAATLNTGQGTLGCQQSYTSSSGGGGGGGKSLNTQFLAHNQQLKVGEETWSGVINFNVELQYILSLFFKKTDYYGKSLIVKCKETLLHTFTYILHRYSLVYFSFVVRNALRKN